LRRLEPPRADRAPVEVVSTYPKLRRDLGLGRRFPIAQTGTTTLMGEQVEFTTRSERGRQILDSLERETGVLRSVSSEGRRAYDLGAGNLDADALLRALRRVAPDWYEHMSYLTLV
jgi:hypothetical protein